MNNIKSKSFNLSFGVPQGSCVEPIAFVVYISPLYEITKEFETNLKGYADDKQAIIFLYNCQKTNKEPCETWKNVSKQLDISS